MTTRNEDDRATPAPGSPPQSGWRWYLVLNVLHLDAPLITVVWQALFARSVGYELLLAERLALFLAVWIVYAGDRVLDGYRLSIGPTTAARHRFSRRHSRSLIRLIATAILAEVALAFFLPLHVLLGGATLGLVVVGYFLWNQLAGTRFGRGWSKEVVVSLVFAGGAALVPLVQAFSWPLLAEVLGFAAVCYANCLLIARLERDRDRDRGERSIAGHLRPDARPSQPLTAFLATVLTLALIILGPNVVGVTLLASVLLLALAPLIEDRCGRDATAAWADLALLTPICTLAFGVA
ncbi:MAG: hypothetical protein WA771_05350 [Chthoniobacterales bacterium]